MLEECLGMTADDIRKWCLFGDTAGVLIICSRSEWCIDCINLFSPNVPVGKYNVPCGMDVKPKIVTAGFGLVWHPSV